MKSLGSAFSKQSAAAAYPASRHSRMQPTGIALGSTPGASNLLDLAYTYNTKNGSADNPDNNGNVLTQTIIVDDVGSNPGFDAVQTYTYDPLNRIKTAEEVIDESSPAAWTQEFTYDRYGNRNFNESATTTLTKNCGTSPNFVMCDADRERENPEIDKDTNRIEELQPDGDQDEDYDFDDAGNTILDPEGRQFFYDGENKQITVKDVSDNVIGEYVYDGDGRRVMKKVPLPGGNIETTIFVYDAGGKLVAEYSTTVASQSTAQVSYLTNDHLGSPRVTTDKNGKVYSRRDFLPFGEDLDVDVTSQRMAAIGYGADSVRQKFTAYERDGETEMDYAKARMFGSGLGRFTSPDPILSSGKVENAQTWNRYSYVLNNPLVFTDPTGLFVWSNELGGDRTDDELLADELAAANNITDEAKRNRAIHRARERVRRIVEHRNNIRAAISRAKESLENLEGSQKAAVENAIDAYGEEGRTNKNVVLGQWQGGGTTGSTLFGEGGKIFVMLGNVSGDDLAVQFTHEGAHVFDFSDFLNGGVDSVANITVSDSENAAWTVSAYTAKGLGMRSYPESLPNNLRVWNAGWTEAEIATGVSNRIAGPGYNNNSDRLSWVQAKNIRLIRSRIDSGAWSDWY